MNSIWIGVAATALIGAPLIAFGVYDRYRRRRERKLAQRRKEKIRL